MPGSQESGIPALVVPNGATSPSEISDEAEAREIGRQAESENQARSPARDTEAVRNTIDWLDLSRTAIEKKETKILARDLESNELRNLKVLFLEGNAGDVGIMAMLNALRAGHLTGLEKFILWEVSSYNQITTAEEGTDIIADAIEDGKLPNLDTLDLTGSLPKLVPARRFSKVVKELLFQCSCGNGRFLEGYHVCMGCLFCNTRPQKNQALECLRCSCGRLQVYSGDDGIRKIGRALNVSPMKRLKVVRLQHNYIGDKGACSLAGILERDKMRELEELDLRNNPVGYKGARKIVFAYLKNPLLTFMLKLDWPSVLLQQKAVSFRDSNIRLEYRTRRSNLPRDSIAINQYIEFEYDLKRHPNAGCFRGHSHRLHLRCQACHGWRFKSHEATGVVAGTVPQAIEIRNRSFFSSPQQNVQRDLDSGTSEDEACEEADVNGWFSSGDESEVLQIGAFVPTTSGTSSPVANSSPERRVVGDQVVSAEAPEPSSLKRRKAVLKRKTGVNRIYITSKSCGFIAAATALSYELRGRDASHTGCFPAWMYRKFMPRYWPWQGKDRTKRQMDSVKAELLMLGERKPDEFYSMFSLRQVLLRNPSGKFKDLYSRVWVCQSCFDVYKKQTVDGHRKVEPITTDDELRLARAITSSMMPQSPKPKPEATKNLFRKVLSKCGRGADNRC